MTNKLKVAVIGAGHLGSRHAKDYRRLNNVELVGLCDTEKEKAVSVARMYNTAAYTDYHDLLDKVSAVSIAVPTSLHHKISKTFLEGGVHVLVEKPITKTLQEADELIDIAKHKNLVLQVGHIERFNSAILALENVLSEPRFIEGHRLGPFTKRGTDVGVVLDLMIHDIDIILSLINSKVKEIQAVGINVLTNHEDIANVRLTFQSGAICNLTASRVTNKQTRKIRIFQENSYISLDYIKQKVLIYKKEHDKIIYKTLKVKKGEPLKKELESFVDCVINKKAPLISGVEGREALKVALQINERMNKNA